jgi:hypothetical protein
MIFRRFVLTRLFDSAELHFLWVSKDTDTVHFLLDIKLKILGLGKFTIIIFFQNCIFSKLQLVRVSKDTDTVPFFC